VEKNVENVDNSLPLDERVDKMKNFQKALSGKAGCDK
jgi:hypothetical protein